jgi:hypothetical protein
MGWVCSLNLTQFVYRAAVIYETQEGFLHRMKEGRIFEIVLIFSMIPALLTGIFYLANLIASATCATPTELWYAKSGK